MPKLEGYPLWALLAVPAILLVGHDVVSAEKAEYLRWTGLVSCWLLIATLAARPLRRLWPSLALGRWMMKNRRALGVGSFWYATLHLAFWLKNASLGSFARSFVRGEIVTGWVAWAIFIALAATSFDMMVRRMGPGWRKLHWWVYPAAALTLLHWLTTAHAYVETAIYVVPVLALMVFARLSRPGASG